MRKSFIFIFLSLVLSACAVTKSPAPIVYNHKNSNLVNTVKRDNRAIASNDGEIISGPLDMETEEAGRNVSKKEEIIEPNSLDEEGFVMPEKATGLSNEKVVYHEVQAGETIDDIALAYHQTPQEIAKQNQLSPPYHIEEFQSLKIVVDNSFKPTNNLVKQAESIEESPQIQEEKPVAPAVEFIKPVDGKIVIKFGENTPYGENKGINIAVPAGTKVQASANGKIIYADFDATFGNLVIVKLDGKSTVTAYAHLEDLIVSKGTSVKQGDIIGYVGATGKVKESQLHFAIREGKKAVDPLKYLKY